MNLRQKAKRYKRLYEETSQMKPRPVHFRHISGNHLRVVRRLWGYPTAGEVEEFKDMENRLKGEMVRDLSEALLNSIRYNDEENQLELDVWV